MPTKNTDRLVQQLAFMAEADKLKQVFRHTMLIDGSRRENDAEHSWHIALGAVLLQEYAAENINMDRVLKILIIHDLVEVYAGDTFAFDIEANKNKEKRETVAAEKLFSQLPPDQEQELRQLWDEFERMDSSDSRFAASLDRIQPFLHNMLTGGGTWIEAHAREKQVLARALPIKTGIPALWPWVLENIEKAVAAGWIMREHQNRTNLLQHL